MRNQQLEYRLYFWGQSVFEKSFLQIVTHILQKAFFKHALKAFQIAIFFVYALLLCVI